MWFTHRITQGIKYLSPHNRRKILPATSQAALDPRVPRAVTTPRVTISLMQCRIDSMCKWSFRRFAYRNLVTTSPSSKWSGSRNFPLQCASIGHCTTFATYLKSSPWAHLAQRLQKHALAYKSIAIEMLIHRQGGWATLQCPVFAHVVVHSNHKLKIDINESWQDNHSALTILRFRTVVCSKFFINT